MKPDDSLPSTERIITLEPVLGTYQLFSIFYWQVFLAGKTNLPVQQKTIYFYDIQTIREQKFDPSGTKGELVFQQHQNLSSFPV